jgi:hypothetical protein
VGDMADREEELSWLDPPPIEDSRDDSLHRESGGPDLGITEMKEAMKPGLDDQDLTQLFALV